MGAYVKLEGLKELRQSLKRIDTELPKEIRAINQRVVNTIVVPEARRRAAQRSNPRVGSKVINSIRGNASQTRAQLVGGGARVPWFKGHEYGSNQLRRTARGGHTTQFPVRAPRMGRGSAGYFFRPAVYNQVPRIMDAYEEMLNGLINRAARG